MADGAGSLDDLKDSLRKKMQKEDISKAVPSRDRFEVENIKYRKNFVFVLERDDNIVRVYDTSLGVDPGHFVVVGPDKFHFGAKTAKEYYYAVYRNALLLKDGVCFLGYVDDEFKPIDLVEPEDHPQPIS